MNTRISRNRLGQCKRLPQLKKHTPAKYLTVLYSHHLNLSNMLSGIKNAGRNLSARHCVDMSLFLAKTGISKANLLLNHCLILFCKPLCIIFIARKSHIAAVQICLNLSKLQSFKVLYTNLLTSGKLQSHLADVEEQPQELFDRLMKQRAECEGISEKLKAANQMEWVGKMNTNAPQSVVTETVNIEVIFV